MTADRLVVPTFIVLAQENDNLSESRYAPRPYRPYLFQEVGFRPDNLYCCSYGCAFPLRRRLIICANLMSAIALNPYLNVTPPKGVDIRGLEMQQGKSRVDESAISKYSKESA